MDCLFIGDEPTDEEVERINKAFRSIDEDFPKLYSELTYNRHLEYPCPCLSVKLIANLLRTIGFDAEVKMYVCHPRTGDIYDEQGTIYQMEGAIGSDNWQPDKISCTFRSVFTGVYHKND